MDRRASRVHLLGAPDRRAQSHLVPNKRVLILLLTGAAAGAALIAFALPAASDRLLYNHTPSVPVGFYIRTNAPVTRGTYVTVRAADVAPEAARARDFEGRRDRFIKRIAAVAGDRVCAEGDVLTINDGPPMSRRTHDSTGAELRRWNGCRALAAHEVLLLGDAEQSFDGRYWGPIDRNLIEGVWGPL
ncbi:MAG: S26 family signal peptidase [Hyphomonadaceae bacterium]|nr:S26 family signal peptidase [Hyphomonadaceae bacterium]